MLVMRPQGGCRSRGSILASASLAPSYETHLGLYSLVIRSSWDSSRNDQTPVCRWSKVCGTTQASQSSDSAGFTGFE